MSAEYERQIAKIDRGYVWLARFHGIVGVAWIGVGVWWFPKYGFINPGVIFGVLYLIAFAAFTNINNLK